MLRATVLTDASYCDKTDSGGFAAWVRVDGIPDAMRYSGPLKSPVKSSTFAEVRAALIGIWYAARAGATHVLIQSDCMTIVHLTHGRCKNPDLVKLWLDAFARDDMRVMIVAKHVKGHGNIKDARTWVNAWCDDAAKSHMYKERRASYKRKRNLVCPPVSR